VDWETFLRDTLQGLKIDGEGADDEPRRDDDNYRAWLAHVTLTLARRRVAYPLHEEERQWGERAVADGDLRWAPDALALLPRGEWPLAVEVEPRAPKSVEQTWLEAVLQYLLGAPDRVYQIAAAERELARGAVGQRRLEWAVDGESVRLPGGSRAPGGGPYR
jgi:hypothetical protein